VGNENQHAWELGTAPMCVGDMNRIFNLILRTKLTLQQKQDLTAFLRTL
jgi:hypothetical protein